MTIRLPDGGAFAIPEDELRWRFTTSGGPGGQHANRSATAVEVYWEPATSHSLTDEQRTTVVAAVGDEISAGSAESRSQWRNRQLARRRLIEKVQEALAPPPPPRKKTRPSRSSQRKRVERKRRHSEKKQLRRRPKDD
ncbi:MAG: aminoacyl-tRNA hydrolase [Acidimicrobiia bacterium]|nr:aminoacyl-tRNA hydrolase [Acidimicrobiia bacterium]